MNRILNVEKILKLNEMKIWNEILNETMKQNIIWNVNVIANGYFDIQMNVCGDLYDDDDDDDDDALMKSNSDAMNVKDGGLSMFLSKPFATILELRINYLN
ncbi:MAG: hypothetical protein EZS28_025283 [Streblomastix strix]|uniref:Uncharacterized protein n=1 Tax=Streblomastix strix TaxID=222440 RepID=A0A5J4V9V0_9EUKA|nr:MAG: hypothetical protein EZS28_025283 [Streblomastix strix]